MTTLYLLQEYLAKLGICAFTKNPGLVGIYGRCQLSLALPSMGSGRAPSSPAWAPAVTSCAPDMEVLLPVCGPGRAEAAREPAEAQEVGTAGWGCSSG